MNVLITGANGFLGSWLTKRLLLENHNVTILVRPSSDLSELQGLSGYHIAYGDVTDPQSVLEACREKEAVFHLAGVIAYKKSDRALMEKVNVTGTDNIIRACLANKVSRLVHLSSVVAVGAGFTSKDVLNEESAYQIAHLNLGYFETKRKAEQLIQQACQNQGLNAVMVNPSTIYGAGDAKKGSRKTQVKVAQGKFPFYTSGGVSVVAVEDVIDGIMLAWAKGKSGERYILSGENLSIRELFEMIAECAGQKPPSIYLPKALLFILGFLGDIKSFFGFTSSLSTENAYTATMFHWFDHSKAKRELGFNPKPARFAITNSVAWMQKNGILRK